MPGPITLGPYGPLDHDGLVALILPIQREEFGIPITLADQPDLDAIPAFYQTGAGEFWVARHEGQVVGSIALKDLGAGLGALRKMFVAAPYRGRDWGVARALLVTLIDHARAHGMTRLYLGTTDRFLAAHRFYEREGFQRVEPEQLPPVFPRLAVDTRFYTLALGA
ncbi:GNAT family N-acetyltransferase [Pararhodospirillum oryzae]|uniref:N-acetyltransferase n=1 Tax=Pararhodospirillum oryzae TaxID=478448 RepID=A0A512HC50_9PROT|nr:GNAT family N-acetyltransferase [Pararhodospirillum oryzae]GEO82970.1 N-acetyltransferase [Pararhodospirillum oryzae]